ncbi:BRISC and BRCA1-A complex member 2-like [Haliotis rubra]|uniref:BRISC and BRCA1-A complex member 2-like n=1 Tax=Haliotis rubra TaxID=36100 RepID=UPI001EE5BC0B|nr:BRISC and BRCA1-A complex member 2-like [Haliotis rubra]
MDVKMVQEAEKEILACISPRIRHMIEALMLEGKVGVCFGKVRVIDTLTSCASVHTYPNCDRFKLIVPYAGQSITWEVLFDCNHPKDPPDFIFGPDDDEFCPNLEDLQCLHDWDYDDSRSLLEMVSELLEKYRLHQQTLIEKSSRLSFDFSSLMLQEEITPTDVEIMLSKNEHGKMGSVKFLVKLSIDFSKIPAYLTKDNPGEDSAMLLLSLPSPESSRVTPQLFLSPKVEHALGGSSSLRIPNFVSGTPLGDYVHKVCQLLKNKVDIVIQGHDKKKEYLASFLSLYGRSVLEYDMENFNKMSYLFEWNDFFFVIIIEMPLFFPKEQPVFTFQSIYHEHKGKPYTESYHDYPYSPRWSGTEMAERARSFILDTVGVFQRTSVQNGQF